MSRAVAMALPLTLVVYAVVAAVHFERWVSAAVAIVVAVLLWRRHRRARFSAYIFLSAMALRSLMLHMWPLAAFAVAVIAALQLLAARRTWPSVNRARSPVRVVNDDRMATP